MPERGHPTQAQPKLNRDQKAVLLALVYAKASGFPTLHVDAIGELAPLALAFRDKLSALQSDGVVAHQSEPPIEGCDTCQRSTAGCDCPSIDPVSLTNEEVG